MKCLVNQFKRNGYNVRITKDNLFSVTIKDESNVIMYMGSFKNYTESTINNIFDELRFN